MAIFKVPSASPSPTSSHSSNSHWSSANGRRSPGRVYKVPSASSSSSSSEASRKGGAGKKSPKGISKIHFPDHLTMRERLSKYAGSSKPSTPELDLGSGELIDLTDLPDYEPSEDSNDSKIVVAHPRAPSSRSTSSNETRQATPNLLDHDNITTSGNNIPEGTPAEFRDAGTLQALIRNSKGHPIPENLCWHVLRSLLRAVLYLHTGSGSTQERHVRPNWQPIIHNGINPANIFFQPGAPDSNGYKTCALGNFSHCVVLPRPWDPDTDEEDELFDRRESWNAICHARDETGFEAPEFWDATSDYIPGPSSDLWSIGAVILAMMTGRNVWAFVLEADSTRPSASKGRQSASPERWQDVSLERRMLALANLKMGGLALGLPRQYYEHLRNLVDCLLSYDPDTRGIPAEHLMDMEAFYTARVAEFHQGTPFQDIFNIFHGSEIHLVGPRGIGSDRMPF